MASGSQGNQTIYQLKASPAKGQDQKGQFAREEILAGTPVFCEPPIFYTTDPTPFGIYKAYHYSVISPSERKGFMALHDTVLLPPLPHGTRIPRLEHEDEQQATRELAYRNAVIRNNLLQKHPMTTIEVPRCASRVAKFENNCFNISSPTDGSTEAWAIFLEAARLNHSCLLNCYAYWNKKEEKLYVYAIEKVRKSQELTIAYGDRYKELRSDRRGRLKERYAFDCPCKICVESSADSVQADKDRQRMIHLTQAIAGHRAAKDISSRDLELIEIGYFKLHEAQARGFAKAIAQMNLGKLYHNLDDLDRAKDKFYQAYKTAIMCLGDSHATVARIKELLKKVEADIKFHDGVNVLVQQVVGGMGSVP